jgi:RimJ/RimL family protein N-acetyltransferase
LPLYEKWINDFEVTRTLGMALGSPMTTEKEEGWYDRASKSDESVMFTVYVRGDELRPIGNTGLHSIDHLNRTAEFGILIGEKDCWDKGYGTEAASLMLDYGFTVLGLHNVYLRVFSYNERGIRAYTRAGFKVSGKLREARRLGDRWYDVIYMDCLASEFASKVLRKLLPEE